jgi:3',5'-cyclic AMP phosphodiesterase CpdA
MSSSLSPTSSSNRAQPALFVIALALVAAGCAGTESPLKIDISKGANPWTHLNLRNNPNEFQFAIVADRTGGHRPGVFEDAVNKLNGLRPEFVISVGDFIEGYTDDEAKLDRQWDEFDALVHRLEMPFFYVPGNHDIGNETTAKKWQQQLGSTYYHFVYRDVLFLCLNTGRSSEGWIDNQQFEYFQNVLARNTNVRWTLVFMHQPAWVGPASESWRKFESLLADRPYTVFAGHLHRYTKSQRQGNSYYILSVTGGSAGEGGKPAGLSHCQFDHIVWATMTNDGPVITNLLLEGILDDNPCP